MEIRYFPTEETFEILKEGEILKEYKQEDIYYFVRQEENVVITLRIRKEEKSKIIFEKSVIDIAKRGRKIVLFEGEYEDCKEILESLGFHEIVRIKKYGKVYKINEIETALEYIEGFGYIGEVELKNLEEIEKIKNTLKIKEIVGKPLILILYPDIGKYNIVNLTKQEFEKLEIVFKRIKFKCDDNIKNLILSYWEDLKYFYKKQDLVKSFELENYIWGMLDILANLNLIEVPVDIKKWFKV